MQCEQKQPEKGMSLIVKTVTGFVKAFVLVFAISIVLYGHLTPGGGFAGGVIVACAFVLITLAEGQSVGLKTVSKNVASELDSVGALIFLCTALVGMFGAHQVFFKNFIQTPETSWFHLLSSGIILICNIGIGLKVSMGLFVVFTMLTALYVAVRGEDRRMMRRGRE